MIRCQVKQMDKMNTKVHEHTESNMIDSQGVKMS